VGYVVYILHSASTDSYYKGQTADIQDRLKRHNAGREKATMHGVPWQLVWSTSKDTRAEALMLERKLKNLSRERTIIFIEKYK
jgi:putative endonuclease